MRQLGKWIFWRFGRNSIPYEIVCALYIALLVFLPANSNGWFNPGETVEVDGAALTLQRDGVRLYALWEGRSPDFEKLARWTRERFGPDTVLIPEPELGDNGVVIKPGDWTWRSILPF